MDNYERTRIGAVLQRWTGEGAVRLYEVNGQSLFPVYNTATGSLASQTAVFPVLRGLTPNAPRFEGAFPYVNGELTHIGEGWIVLCILLPLGFTATELEAALEHGEKQLLAMQDAKAPA